MTKPILSFEAHSKSCFYYFRMTEAKFVSTSLVGIIRYTMLREIWTFNDYEFQFWYASVSTRLISVLSEPCPATSWPKLDPSEFQVRKIQRLRFFFDQRNAKLVNEWLSCVLNCLNRVSKWLVALRYDRDATKLTKSKLFQFQSRNLSI